MDVSNVTTKVCARCGKEKPLSEFYVDSQSKDGRNSWCKDCHKKYGREYRVARKEKLREIDYIRRYGVDLKTYKALLESQRGRCAICGKLPKGNEKRLGIDHDHETGKIRGLLCERCNMGLGFFNDDPQLLQKAIEYLTQNE